MKLPLPSLPSRIESGVHGTLDINPTTLWLGQKDADSVLELRTLKDIKRLHAYLGKVIAYLEAK